MLKTLLEDDDDIRLAHERYKQFTNDEDMRRLYLAREKTERDRLYHNNIARREGLKEGELEDKHNVLIRQLDLKYRLTEKEKSRILSVNDLKKLDSALDTVVISNNKESVFKFL